jgi:hypothetical protein
VRRSTTSLLRAIARAGLHRLWPSVNFSSVHGQGLLAWVRGRTEAPTEAPGGKERVGWCAAKQCGASSSRSGGADSFALARRWKGAVCTHCARAGEGRPKERTQWSRTTEEAGAVAALHLLVWRRKVQVRRRHHLCACVGRRPCPSVEGSPKSCAWLVRGTGRTHRRVHLAQRRCGVACGRVTEGALARAVQLVQPRLRRRRRAAAERHRIRAGEETTATASLTR